MTIAIIILLTLFLPLLVVLALAIHEHITWRRFMRDWDASQRRYAEQRAKMLEEMDEQVRRIKEGLPLV